MTTGWTCPVCNKGNALRLLICEHCFAIASLDSSARRREIGIRPVSPKLKESLN